MNLMAKFTNINREQYSVIYSTYDYLSLKMVTRQLSLNGFERFMIQPPVSHFEYITGLGKSYVLYNIVVLKNDENLAKNIIKDFVVPKTPSPDEGMNNKKIYIIPYVISIIIFIFILLLFIMV